MILIWTTCGRGRRASAWRTCSRCNSACSWPIIARAALFSTDAAVVHEAGRYLRIAALSQLFLGAEVVLESAMGGAGYTLPPMLGSTAITALRIPVGAWAATQFGTTGL